jgi:hypothetical protein
MAQEKPQDIGQLVDPPRAEALVANLEVDVAAKEEAVAQFRAERDQAATRLPSCARLTTSGEGREVGATQGSLAGGSMSKHRMVPESIGPVGTVGLSKLGQ